MQGAFSFEKRSPPSPVLSSKLKLCKMQSWFVHRKIIFFSYGLFFPSRVSASSNYQCSAFLLINSAEGLALTVGRALIIFYSFC